MSAIDWSIVGLYFLALAVIGWRERKSFSGSPSQVILGGRALTLPAFVATLVTTWYGGILGVGEYSYTYGISNWLVFGVPYYIAAALFALFLAKRARGSETLTIPQRICESFGKKSGLLSAVLIFLTSAPTAYALMLGALAQFFFGVDPLAGALVAGVFSLVYVFFGGFNAVVRTDKLQFALMFGSFAALFILLISEYGFWDFLRSAVPDSHFTWHGGAGGWYIASWYVIALGTLIEPSFHQRCFAAKDESIAKKGILLSIAFWALFDFLTTFCGLYARALIPELSDPTLAFPALALLKLPPVLLGMFVVGLLAVVMSTIDSYSFVAATTYSYDFIGRLKRGASENLHKHTLIGLALSTALAFGMALFFDSIITVWREFGSVLLPSLLAPLVIAYYFPKRSLTDLQTLVLISVPGLVSLGWILHKYLGSSGAYPFSGYPFLSEPIFPGLYVSISLLTAFLVANRNRPLATIDSETPSG